WEKLPITANSTKFKGTYCISASGGEVWTPEYVVLYKENKEGLIVEVDNIDDRLSLVEQAVENIDVYYPRITIPSVVYAVVGKQLNIYYDAVILGLDKGL